MNFSLRLEVGDEEKWRLKMEKQRLEVEVEEKIKIEDEKVEVGCWR